MSEVTKVEECNPFIEGVITYETIEEQSQIFELHETFKQGYTNLTCLGAGLILLTKEEIELSGYEASQICRKMRGKLISGTKHAIDIETEDIGANSEIFVLHVCKINKD